MEKFSKSKPLGEEEKTLDAFHFTFTIKDETLEILRILHPKATLAVLEHMQMVTTLLDKTLGMRIRKYTTERLSEMMGNREKAEGMMDDLDEAMGDDDVQKT